MSQWLIPLVEAGDMPDWDTSDVKTIGTQATETRHWIQPGSCSRAWEDLAQARHIAEPSGMRLYLCDALIEEAWLHHLAGDAEMARAAFERAEAEVDDMGYHWQDPELAKLRLALD